MEKWWPWDDGAPAELMVTSRCFADPSPGQGVTHSMQRRLTTILATDVAGYSRLVGEDEEGTLQRLRALRAELINPAIERHRGRIVNTAGDSILVEFTSVVDAVRCAVEVQRDMMARNADFVPEKRIAFRAGIHLGDVMVESNGDLMGDGVNIAARLEGICEPGGICLSHAAYEQVKGKLDLTVRDLGEPNLKNIAQPIRVYSVNVGKSAEAKPATQKYGKVLLPLATGLVALVAIVGGAWYFVGVPRLAAIATNPSGSAADASHFSIVVLPFTNLSGELGHRLFRRRYYGQSHYRPGAHKGQLRDRAEYSVTYKGKNVDVKEIGKDLGVRYVLEGSVMRDQARAHVNAQLIDAESGSYLWAERFEEDIADLFKLQDQVVARSGLHRGF